MKEDHEIIELYWARSESAVHETDEKYGAKLHTLSGRILPDAEDAEECVNDTYLGAWNAMPPQRPLAFFAFLARICRNIACDKLDKLRAKKRSAEVSALTEELSACIADPTAAREAESREIAEALNSFLSTLPVDARLFFMRRYWYMDSVKAIAEKYGCGESRVKTSLHRTREKLRDYLQKEDIWI